jgi:transcriptional regulator with XRE-family HTH domain
MGLRGRLKRLEHDARKEMVEIPQRDGTVKRFPRSARMEAFLYLVDVAVGNAPTTEEPKIFGASTTGAMETCSTKRKNGYMIQRSLAERLRVLQAQRGLTLVEASAMTGVGRDTRSDLERGRRHPVMPTLSKIARGYDVPTEELLEEPVATGRADASWGAGRRESETERREDTESAPHAASVAALIEILTEEANRVSERTMSSPGKIPVGHPNRFYAALDVASRGYEELAQAGQVSEELREAKKKLHDEALCLGDLLFQIIRPGSKEKYEPHEMWKQLEMWRQQRVGSQEQRSPGIPDTGVV